MSNQVSVEKFETLRLFPNVIFRSRTFKVVIIKLSQQKGNSPVLQTILKLWKRWEASQFV